MTKEYFPDGVSLDPQCSVALTCFVKNGYHGTSIRQIATAAGLSVPGLYHYYPSKASLLEKLCEVAMRELLHALDQAWNEASGPLDRFDQVISCLLQFHAKFGDIAFVTYSEIRSLDPLPLEQHLEARRKAQGYVTRAVEEGCEASIFATPFPRHTARAITHICLGVSQWYRPGNSMDVAELVESYTQICRDTVRYVRSTTSV